MFGKVAGQGPEMPCMALCRNFQHKQGLCNKAMLPKQIMYRKDTCIVYRHIYCNMIIIYKHFYIYFFLCCKYACV